MYILISALWSDDDEEVVEVSVDQGTSNVTSGLTFAEQLELRKLELEFKERQESKRLELELEAKERQESRRLELELEAKKEVETKRLELEAKKLEHEFRLKELEFRQSSAQVPVDKVKINDCYRSLPNFDESEIEGFFKQFERIATELQWPNEYWHILVQSKFRGKATVAYNSLSEEQAKDYAQVKSAILRAYEVTSEAYRQQFRNLKKLVTETYSEFISKKGNLFDKWIRAESVQELTEVRNLMVLEEVRNSMTPGLRLLLSDRKVVKLDEVAEVADNYVLVHKFRFLRGVQVQAFQGIAVMAARAIPMEIGIGSVEVALV